MLAGMRRAMAALGVIVLLAGGLAHAAGLDLDRRRMLNAAEHVPWRAVGRVNAAGEHFTSMCTGTLIAPDVVLTAAHCLTDPRTREPYPAGNLYFVAGWRMGQKVAARGVAAIALHPAYRFSDHPGPREIATDLALIRLAEPISADEAEPFIVDQLRPGEPLVLISYRQDRPHALTRQEGCEVIARGVAERPAGEASSHSGEGTEAGSDRVDLDNIIVLDCDVTFGVSGSPLFAAGGTRPRVIAVMSAMQAGGRKPMAFAVLVAGELDRLLARLPEAEAGPAPLTAPPPRPRSAIAMRRLHAAQ